MTARAGYRRLGRMLGRRRRRGSTILLVITILSLLALLAVTMSFTSQLEISSANNFSTGVQNRIAALTSVEAIATQLNASLPAGPTSPLDLALNGQFLDRRPGQGASESRIEQLFSYSPNANVREVQSNLDSNDTNTVRPVFSAVHRTGTGNVVITDASGRININASTEQVLAGFFDAIAEERNLPKSGARIARAIASVRLGPDGAAGVENYDDDFDASDAIDVETEDNSIARVSNTRPAQQALRALRDVGSTSSIDAELRRRTREQLVYNTDEPDEYIADIRVPAFGDDVRFSSVQDLLRYPEITGAGLTVELLEAASPYLTVLSTSIEQRLVNGKPATLVDINRATAEEIYDALVELYGASKNDVMLRQFAVNIADARDFDNVPSVLEGDVEIIGIERTPFITEVYANALTLDEEGDDGQFVEIYNPWNTEIDVTGWQLRGPGGQYPLRGKIQPKGFLLITDDVDNSLDANQDQLPGTGSLYDIFGILPDNRLRTAINIPHFTIPDAGPVKFTLNDASGNLVDSFFAVIDQRDEDTLYSWQRDNWMIRQVVRRHATPFALPPLHVRPESSTIALLENYPTNGPFVDVADLFYVFAGFADKASATYNPWGFPLAVTPSSSAPDDVDLAKNSATIDARIVDIFAVDHRVFPSDEDQTGIDRFRRDALAEPRELPAALRTGSAGMEGQQLQAFVANNFFAPPAGLRHGRINLNTAPEVALASLPGIDRQVARKVVERRQDMIRRAQQGGMEDAVTYHSLSDVLVDDLLLGHADSPAARLQAFRSLLPHICLNTRSFVVVSQPRTDSGGDFDLAWATRIEALVSMDRGTEEIIYWRRFTNGTQSGDNSVLMTDAGR